jgi:chromosome segregation ATPase
MSEVAGVHEHRTQSGESEQAGEPGVVALTAIEFAALEARILRAVEVVRRERQARTAAEERASQAETQARELSAQVSQLEQELSTLRAEREHVRERVERLLGQLDALEL